jgi:hypothetical protein
MNSFARTFDRFVLVALIAFEMAACYNFYRREIAWYPPGNWDQSGYLAIAYRTKEQILTNGLGQFANIVRSPSNTGMALPILGAVSGICFGGGRLPVLLVPFLGFVLLQLSVFFTARAVWRSQTYGYLLLGLVLCLNTPWYWAGGLFDFRFDFMAFSLFGIWACSVMQSQLFLDRRWAVVCGLIGAFLALTRFLTFVYLLGICAGFGVLCLAVALLWRHDGELVRRMWQRVYNLGLAVGVLAIIAIPFLAFSWPQIFEYYGVGHLLSNVSSARAHQNGVDGLVDRLFFYPNSILQDHWGVGFVLGAAIVLFGSLILGLSNSRKARKLASQSQGETFILQIAFLLGAILGPIVVLSLDTDKNSVVGGIVGVPVALLVVAVSARVVGVANLEARSASRTMAFLGLIVFTLGVGTVFDRISRHNPEYAERADLMRLVQLNKWMVTYAGDHGWNSPGISVDTISPWFNGYSIIDTGYEESGTFVDFHPMLGSNIMGADRRDALAQLAQSDFLILTTPTTQDTGVDQGSGSPDTSHASYEWLSVLRRLKPFYNPAVQPARIGISLEGSTASLQRWPALRQHLYPFYIRLAEYRDELKDWADKNMTLAQTVPFDHFTATVYVRSTPGSSLSDSAH